MLSSSVTLSGVMSSVAAAVNRRRARSTSGRARSSFSVGSSRIPGSSFVGIISPPFRNLGRTPIEQHVLNHIMKMHVSREHRGTASSKTLHAPSSKPARTGKKPARTGKKRARPRTGRKITEQQQFHRSLGLVGEAVQRDDPTLTDKILAGRICEAVLDPPASGFYPSTL